jgi:hypothetical protein
MLHEFTTRNSATWSLAMNTRTDKDFEPIDHKTSRSICKAIGEQLQRSLRPELSVPSNRLEQLLDELRRRDRPGSD